MSVQPSLLELFPCDICRNGIETDPETQRERPCRVCGGSQLLDYDPTLLSDGDPFTGLDKTVTLNRDLMSPPEESA